MTLWDRATNAMMTRLGDTFTTTKSNITYTFSGILDQEQVIDTDANGGQTVVMKTVVTLKTSDAVNVARQQIITKGTKTYEVQVVELMGDGVLSKAIVVET